MSFIGADNEPNNTFFREKLDNKFQFEVKVQLWIVVEFFTQFLRPIFSYRGTNWMTRNHFKIYRKK